MLYLLEKKKTLQEYNLDQGSAKTNFFEVESLWFAYGLETACFLLNIRGMTPCVMKIRIPKKGSRTNK